MSPEKIDARKDKLKAKPSKIKVKLVSPEQLNDNDLQRQKHFQAQNEFYEEVELLGESTSVDQIKQMPRVMSNYITPVQIAARKEMLAGKPSKVKIKHVSPEQSVERDFQRQKQYQEQNELHGEVELLGESISVDQIKQMPQVMLNYMTPEQIVALKTKQSLREMVAKISQTRFDNHSLKQLMERDPLRYNQLQEQSELYNRVDLPGGSLSAKQFKRLPNEFSHSLLSEQIFNHEHISALQKEIFIPHQFSQKSRTVGHKVLLNSVEKLLLQENLRQQQMRYQEILYEQIELLGESISIDRVREIPKILSIRKASDEMVLQQKLELLQEPSRIEVHKPFLRSKSFKQNSILKLSKANKYDNSRRILLRQQEYLYDDIELLGESVKKYDVKQYPQTKLFYKISSEVVISKNQSQKKDLKYLVKSQIRELIKDQTILRQNILQQQDCLYNYIELLGETIPPYQIKQLPQIISICLKTNEIAVSKHLQTPDIESNMREHKRLLNKLVQRQIKDQEKLRQNILQENQYLYNHIELLGETISQFEIKKLPQFISLYKETGRPAPVRKLTNVQDLNLLTNIQKQHVKEQEKLRQNVLQDYNNLYNHIELLGETIPPCQLKQLPDIISLYKDQSKYVISTQLSKEFEIPTRISLQNIERNKLLLQQKELRERSKISKPLTLEEISRREMLRQNVLQSHEHLYKQVDLLGETSCKSSDWQLPSQTTTEQKERPIPFGIKTPSSKSIKELLKPKKYPVKKYRPKLSVPPSAQKLTKQLLFEQQKLQVERRQKMLQPQDQLYKKIELLGERRPIIQSAMHVQHTPPKISRPKQQQKQKSRSSLVPSKPLRTDTKEGEKIKNMQVELPKLETKIQASQWIPHKKPQGSLSIPRQSPTGSQSIHVDSSHLSEDIKSIDSILSHISKESQFSQLTWPEMHSQSSLNSQESHHSQEMSKDLAPEILTPKSFTIQPNKIKYKRKRKKIKKKSEKCDSCKRIL